MHMITTGQLKGARGTLFIRRPIYSLVTQVIASLSNYSPPVLFANLRAHISAMTVFAIPRLLSIVRFVLFCDVSVPSYNGLVGYLEFNQTSRVPPVFISATLEATVLLPKFLRACPNALFQRKRFNATPHCFDGRLQSVSPGLDWPLCKRSGTGCVLYDHTSVWTDPT